MQCLNLNGKTKNLKSRSKVCSASWVWDVDSSPSETTLKSCYTTFHTQRQPPVWPTSNITSVAKRQPLWSGSQSSWLQIRRSGFDSRRYQIFWELVDMERGPLSIVSTNEVLGRKVSGSGLENREYGRRIRHADNVAPSISKRWC
jgi:hypothetical protein